MCLFIKVAFKLVLLVTQHKNRTVLDFPEVRHLPEENLFPTALLLGTYITKGEMGSVLPFCRETGISGRPDYPSSAFSPHPHFNGGREAGKLAPWPEMGGGQVQGSHRSCRRQQRS